MRPTSGPGAPPNGSPSQRHPPSTPRPDSARTSGGRDVRAVQLIATRPCLLARLRSELRQRLVHLALKPTPIHIGGWRPEPSQNLRHLAARKARPGRRAALGLIHRHRHNHHLFAAACYGGSLRWPTEATVSSKRARCARCSSRASTTKLSRRSCRRRARRRAAAPRGDRYLVRPAGRGAARGDRAARAGGGDRVGSAARRVARGMAARAVAPCQRNVPLGRSRAGMSRPAPGTRTALNPPRLRRNE
jgi:hypothetical protein